MNYSTNILTLMCALQAVEKLSKCHIEHISQYGLGNEARLTGKHETCDINTFRHGELLYHDKQKGSLHSD